MKLRETILKAGFRPFDQSGAATAKQRAQNTVGSVTHYYEESTLRFFFSRVVSSRMHCDGALHVGITRDAMDPDNRTRGYRFIVHDFTGYCVERAEIADAYPTRAKCEKARDAWLAQIKDGGLSIVREALRREYNAAVQKAETIKAALSEI